MYKKLILILSLFLICSCGIKKIEPIDYSRLSEQTGRKVLDSDNDGYIDIGYFDLDELASNLDITVTESEVEGYVKDSDQMAMNGPYIWANKIPIGFGTSWSALLAYNDDDTILRLSQFVDSTANTDEALDDSETEITVTDSSVLFAELVMKVGTEYMLIDSIDDGTTITVQRGYWGSTAAAHDTNQDIHWQKPFFFWDFQNGVFGTYELEDPSFNLYDVNITSAETTLSGIRSDREIGGVSGNATDTTPATKDSEIYIRYYKNNVKTTAVTVGENGVKLRGNTLMAWFSKDGEPPSSNYATIDTRNQIPVLDFNDSTDESIEFSGIMPRSYSGNGVTLILGWMATDTTVTPHNCIWQAAFKSVTSDTDDLDSKAFAAANSVTDAEASASGEVVYAEITFTDGADMDSVAAGEYFRLKVNRDADNGSDNLTDDSELVSVEMRDTP